MVTTDAHARFPGLTARDLVEVSADLAVLDRGGRWAVALGFEGEVVLARFRDWGPEEPPVGEWPGVSGPWETSLTQPEYERSVLRVQQHIDPILGRRSRSGSEDERVNHGAGFGLDLKS